MQTTKLEHCKIRTCQESNGDFRLLYHIFSATLYPGMPFRHFRAFYHSESLDYIDVTFIYDDSRLIGFCAAAFYTTAINDQPVVIGRAATGILQGERGGKLPRWSLYAKYMLYKLRHPFSNILLTIYVANPLVYAMICKYTAIVYPRMTVDVDETIQGIKTGVLRHSGLENRESSPFVIKIHFKVQLGEDIIKRSLESDDVFVRYYLAINPEFQTQNGVLTIVPVTWENVLRSCEKLLRASLFKTARRRGKSLAEKEDCGQTRESQQIITTFQQQNHRKSHDEGLLPDIRKENAYSAAAK